MDGNLNEIKIQDITLQKRPPIKPVVVDVGSSSSGTSGNNSQNGGRTILRTRKKRLPTKFAEEVMELESDIACGKFNLNTVN